MPGCRLVLSPVTRLTYSIGTDNAAADADDDANGDTGALTPPRGDGDWAEFVFPAWVVVAGSTTAHVGGRGALRISDTTCLKKRKVGFPAQQ